MKGVVDLYIDFSGESDGIHWSPGVLRNPDTLRLLKSWYPHGFSHGSWFHHQLIAVSPCSLYLPESSRIQEIQDAEEAAGLRKAAKQGAKIGRFGWWLGLSSHGVSFTALQWAFWVNELSGILDDLAGWLIWWLQCCNALPSNFRMLTKITDAFPQCALLQHVPCECLTVRSWIDIPVWLHVRNVEFSQESPWCHDSAQMALGWNSQFTWIWQDLVGQSMSWEALKIY